MCQNAALFGNGLTFYFIISTYCAFIDHADKHQVAHKVEFNPGSIMSTSVQNILPDSRCDRIHSSLIAGHCFADGYVGKQQVGWKRILSRVLVKIIPGKHG